MYQIAEHPKFGLNFNNHMSTSQVKKVLLTFCLLAFSLHFAVAQVDVLQQRARAEISQRGLSEDVVRAKLLAKGINIDQIKPEDLVNLQPTIEAVLAEAEAEKNAAANQQSNQTVEAKVESAIKNEVKNISAGQAKNIEKKVSEGASVAEAVAEEVTDVINSNLPPATVFGQHFFRDKSLTLFRTTNDVKAPDLYILSTGDEILISIFGRSQFDGKYTINQEGFIQPTQMGKIFLRGMRLDKARELLKSRFSTSFVYSPEQIVVSLTTARAVSVNIFGEVENYGTFTVSAVNTALNALVAAGGPTDIGSVRNIELVRGKTRRKIDVYEFMNNPAVQYDLYLEDNDIIYVPVAQKVVSIKGEITRPFKYELLEKENLNHLISYAGGLKPEAYREVIQLSRFVEDKEILIDVPFADLSKSKGDFNLLNGDIITIKRIPTAIENTVRIKGAVALAGSYAISETKHLSDLINKAELRKEARTDLAFLFRKNSDGSSQLVKIDIDKILANQRNADIDLVLKPADEVIVYGQERFTDNYAVSVSGAVRDTFIEHPYDPGKNMTIRDLMVLAGGLAPDANGLGYILRIDPNKLKEKQYLPVNLTAAMADASSKSNLKLEPRDELIVLSQNSFSDQAEIRVSGSVRKSGSFRFGAQMNLRDVLLLAGGLKMGAAYNRIDIFRIIIRQNEQTKTIAATIQVDSNLNVIGQIDEGFQLMPFDEIIVRDVPDFEPFQFVTLEGEVAYPGTYAIISPNERVSDLIKRAGGFTSEAFLEGATLFRSLNAKGFVITDFKTITKNPNSGANHVLKPGDKVQVPKSEDIISLKIENTDAVAVLGSKILFSPYINVAQTSGKRAGWYIREYAGGFAKNAKRSKLVVEYPNGKINKTKDFGIFKIYPKVTKGSVISVPAKTKKQSQPKQSGGAKKEKDWDKVFTQILSFSSVTASMALAFAALRGM
jgi:protein involved in polysaccharide export with SLBB domain